MTKAFEYVILFQGSHINHKFKTMPNKRSTNTAIFPADRSWERSGNPSPFVGVGIGGPKARAKQLEYLVVIYGLLGIGSVFATWWLFTHTTGIVEWSAFTFGYLTINFGLSVGFHRYFSHRSFETTRVVHYLLAITGHMACLGSGINWAADHRRHHAHTNVPGDPYAPNFDGHGRPMQGIKSFFMCHIGWLLDNTYTDVGVYGKGLAGDPALEWCHRTRWFWVIFSLFILPAGWALLFGGPEHIVGTILIGGLLRTFIFANGVGFTNSLAHGFGYSRFKDCGDATNNWFVALLTLGDGWHNNHHNAPRAANNLIGWWEIDINGWTIEALEKLGLAWNVQKRSNQVQS
ncbi:MAG: acyl-CoA desaturase [Sphingorhabdus sp.]